MKQKLAVVGLIIAASSIFFFMLELVSEQYQAYRTQEIELIYDQEGMRAYQGRTFRTATFRCLSGDKIYLRGEGGSGPIEAYGSFEVWEELSGQASRRVYRQTIKISLRISGRGIGPSRNQEITLSK